MNTAKFLGQWVNLLNISLMRSASAVSITNCDSNEVTENDKSFLAYNADRALRSEPGIRMTFRHRQINKNESEK